FRRVLFRSSSPFSSAGPVGSAGDPGTALEKGLDTLLAAGCPTPSDDLWLCLASFEVTLDATPMPVDLSDPDNTIPERRTLLPTNALQALLLDLAADGASAGLLSGGPRIGALSFTADAAKPMLAGTLELPVLLAKKGDPPADVPLVE